MIELSHISKSFNGKVALNDVSLHIDEGETVCILGSTGSGKSTLMRCIAGLEKQDEGTILFGGAPVSLSNSNRYRKMGMVFQNFSLFPHLNVLHNLTLAPMKVLGCAASDAEEMAMQALASVGLAEKRALFPRELSAGQRQRVAIAQALVMQPSVLLLDEPTSALDPVSVNEVLNVLRRLKKEVTIVIVTHAISFAQEFADRVVFMADGQVCEQGTPNEVINNPQRAETREFMSHHKNLMYEIRSALFDRHELNALIEFYCNRFGLGRQAFHFVQLAVEELLNILPLEGGLSLVLSKWDDEVRMSLDVKCTETGRDYLSTENVDDELSLSILQGLCEVMEEISDGAGNRLIHIEIGQERLLLK